MLILSTLNVISGVEKEAYFFDSRDMSIGTLSHSYIHTTQSRT
jgi:hypothetical protein